jgi:hypothetical protein
LGPGIVCRRGGGRREREIEGGGGRREEEEGKDRDLRINVEAMNPSISGCELKVAT